MIEKNSLLWRYLSPTQQTLLEDGTFLVEDSAHHRDREPTDYSYLVFPFAKLYEGFLKQLFLDTGIIDKSQYVSDRFRIGKALSPHLVSRLHQRSAYAQLKDKYGEPLAQALWEAWKTGRNLVFHYFPHNYRALTLDRAKETIQLILDAMQLAVTQAHISPREKQQ